ncbi:ADP-ribosylation factor-like protein 15 [Salvelinus sp. IW2-2015]|uniref:ADP-ribosylation factor-like protein 15 n=1 Tax=Salvelinus sp. IW2-2015 TaxID=2691554 RepID=UPI0038D3AE56
MSLAHWVCNSVGQRGSKVSDMIFGWKQMALTDVILPDISRLASGVLGPRVDHVSGHCAVKDHPLPDQSMTWCVLDSQARGRPVYCPDSAVKPQATSGQLRVFSIKAVPFQNAILNVKELGGADSIKKYWSRYYQGSQGVVFILDSASTDEDLEMARTELHSALQHPQLCTLPFLILANHQDKPAARTTQEIKKYFELEPLARGKSWILEGSSVDNMDAVKQSFTQLIELLEDKDQDTGRI